MMRADVAKELARARDKFPQWPDDPLHAFAILNEEVGELGQAILQQVYEPWKGDRWSVEEEAVQVAAMAERFLDSLKHYKYRKCGHHVQPIACAACDRGDFQFGHADGCAKKEATA
jgi:NTP pyrophosphatase (non-canonical NTP hydrolase)